MGVEVRHHSAEVSLEMLLGKSVFDRWNTEDCGVAALHDIEDFCQHVRLQGGNYDTLIALGRRRMWVIIPNPCDEKDQREVS